jgi:hypothetical protein
MDTKRRLNLLQMVNIFLRARKRTIPYPRLLYFRRHLHRLLLAYRWDLSVLWLL